MPNSAPMLTSLAKPGYLVGGKYELDKVIGYGGMGSVWRATHVSLGQRVAVKIISAAHCTSSDARRRFDMEAKAAAVLRSRYAVQVYDNGEFDDGTPYIVMEHLEGESLERRIHHHGPMSLDEAARVLSHVGRALNAAHKSGIVHRDIKPENIYLSVSTEEDDFVAKVLDFGIAKVCATQNSTDATRTGSIMGTPQYMSPEQARGTKGIDFRTDLYSLGALTYTMLTGNLVFDADTLGEMVLKVCGDPLPLISDAAPWVPSAVDDWFHKACARNPDDRFRSVNEMVDAFLVAAGLALPKRPVPLRGSSRDPEIMIRTVLNEGDTDATGQLRKPQLDVVKVGNPFAVPGTPLLADPNAHDRSSITPMPSSQTLASDPSGAGALGAQSAMGRGARGVSWGFVAGSVVVAAAVGVLLVNFLGIGKTATNASGAAVDAPATVVPPMPSSDPAPRSTAPASIASTVPAASAVPVAKTAPEASATVRASRPSRVTASPPKTEPRTAESAPPAPPPVEQPPKKPTSALEDRF